MDIKFVSYTGKYPNLCNGVLTLLVDDKEYKFSWKYVGYVNDEGAYVDYPKEGERKYPNFWCSGGSVNWKNVDEDIITENDWIIDKTELPEELQPYYKEIEKIFNENVPKGCCGGCL